MLKNKTILDLFITFMWRHSLRGRSRILSLLRQHQPYYLVQAISKHGLCFNLEPEDYIDGLILKNGYYEEEVLTSILQHIDQRGVLWDIGANIGTHAITVKSLCPQVQVVCFEPSPFTFSRLYLNTNVNKVDLTLLNIGLGNSIGYHQLSLTLRGNSGLTSFKPWREVSYQHEMICYCDTAVNLVKQGIIPIPTVVKIDVEGFEFEALSGFEDLLKDQKLQAIIFESPSDLLEMSSSYPIYNLLQVAGFEISVLYSMNKEEKTLPTNFLAKRRSLTRT